MVMATHIGDSDSGSHGASNGAGTGSHTLKEANNNATAGALHGDDDGDCFRLDAWKRFAYAGQGDADALWHPQGLQPRHGQSHWQLQGMLATLKAVCRCICPAITRHAVATIGCA